MSFEWKKVLLFSLIISLAYFIFSFLAGRAVRDMEVVGFWPVGGLILLFIIPLFLVILFIVVGIIAFRRFRSRKILHVSSTLILGIVLIWAPAEIINDISWKRADKERIAVFDERLVIVQRALTQNDASICDQLPYDYLINSTDWGGDIISPQVCKGMIAAKIGDFSVCRVNAPDSYTEYPSGLRATCLLTAAKMTEDLNVCRFELDKSSGKDSRASRGETDTCISGYAEWTKNKKLCDQITYDLEKKSCLNVISQQEKESEEFWGGSGGVAYCERQVRRGSYRNLCIADRAWKTNNPLLCDLIDEATYPSAEEACRLRFKVREQVQRN